MNEYSARYSILDNEFNIPKSENLASQSSANNQGRGDVLEGEEANKVIQILKSDSLRSYKSYEKMLSKENKKGLARELARMNLPTNIYTQWYWKTDLHNLFNFIRLRNDLHAQYEIRVYAEKIAELVKKWVPFSFEAFEQYQLNSSHLSSNGLSCIKRLMKGEDVSQDNSGMGKREWKEFCEIIGKDHK